MKCFISTSLFLFAVLTNVIAGTNGYDIKVKVNGISQGMFQLANYYGDKQYLKDSARVDSKGLVIFKGENPLERGIYLVVSPDKKYFEIIVDEVQSFSLETDTTDFVKSMLVKGSEENRIFYEYLNFLTPKGKQVAKLNEQIKALEGEAKKDEEKIKELKEQITAIDKEVIAYKKEIPRKYPESFVAMFLKAMEEPEIPEAPILDNGRQDSTFKFRYYKAHYWDNINFSDDRILRTPIYHNKLKKFVENLALQMPDSINSTADIVLKKAKAGHPELFKYSLWWVTNTYERSKIMCMDAVFVHMVENYYKKGDAYWIDSLQLEKIVKRSDQLALSLCGKVVKNVVMKDAAMKDASLYNVKAKYTVMFIWDPDCGHCKKETPKLLETYHKLKPKGLEIYAICTDVDFEKWQAFIKEKNLDWINVWDPYNTTNFRHIFDVYSTPVVYILNDKKEIIAKRIGVEQIEEILEKQFEFHD